MDYNYFPFYNRNPTLTTKNATGSQEEKLIIIERPSGCRPQGGTKPSHLPNLLTQPLNLSKNFIISLNLNVPQNSKETSLLQNFEGTTPFYFSHLFDGLLLKCFIIILPSTVAINCFSSVFL